MQIYILAAHPRDICVPRVRPRSIRRHARERWEPHGVKKKEHAYRSEGRRKEPLKDFRQSYPRRDERRAAVSTLLSRADTRSDIREVLSVCMSIGVCVWAWHGVPPHRCRAMCSGLTVGCREIFRPRTRAPHRVCRTFESAERLIDSTAFSTVHRAREELRCRQARVGLFLEL